jgi:hypothetical protein
MLCYVKSNVYLTQNTQLWRDVYHGLVMKMSIPFMEDIQRILHSVHMRKSSHY